MDRIDALYELPLADFTRARDALAAELRQAGEREEARRVKALRRPTVSAWTLNRVAREHPAAMAELVEVAVELEQAQQGALSGGDADALRQAMRRRRAAIDAIAAAAAAILRDEGAAPAPHLSAIRSTLEAAAVDQDLAATLAEGRLSRELTESSDPDRSGADRSDPDRSGAGGSGAGGLRLLQGGLSTSGLKDEAQDEQAAEEEHRTRAAHKAAALAAEAEAAEEQAATARAEAEVAAAEANRLEQEMTDALVVAHLKTSTAEATAQAAAGVAARARRDADQAAAELAALGTDEG